MAINRNNYQVYFIDHYEGILSPKETLVLMAFLDDNPDLKSEFDNFDVEPLVPDPEVTFKGKDSLKKQVFAKPAEGDAMLIAYVEGDLQEGDRRKIKERIETEAVTKYDLEQYQSTLLIPDQEVTYPYKAELKRTIGTSILFTQWSRYAAAALIFILLGTAGYYVFRPESDTISLHYELARLESSPPQLIDVTVTATLLTLREPLTMGMPENYRDDIRPLKLTPVTNTNIEISPAFVYSGHLFIPEETIQYQDFPNVIDSEALAVAEEPKRKTMAGRIINGMFGKVKQPSGDKNRNDQSPNRGNFTFWDIAEFGVKSVNALGDHDYTLVREYNDKGKVKGIMVLEE